MFKRVKPEQSKELKDLLAWARGYAEHMMRTTGSVPPTFVANSPEGFMLYVPDGLQDADAKQRFADRIRLVAVAYRATAGVMLLESWATFPDGPGQPLPEGRPSESPNRQEVVALVGEARGACAQQFLFIQRDGSGKFTGFGTSVLPQFDDLEGRFAQMMPAKEPSHGAADTAKALLKTMKVVVIRQDQDPTWN